MMLSLVKSLNLIHNYSYKPYEIKDGKLYAHKIKKNYAYTNLFFKK